MISRLFSPKQHPRPVGWWEPRWSFVPRALQEVRSAFPITACLRILWVSAIATAAIFGLVEILMRPGLPAFQFNWLKAFGRSVGGIAIYIAFMTCFSIAIPPRITVSTKGLMRQVGQSVRFIKREDIRAVHVVLRRADRHFIRIETSKGAMRIGLSRKLSLLALDAHFGARIVVHERRKAKQAPCSSLTAA